MANFKDYNAISTSVMDTGNRMTWTNAMIRANGIPVDYSSVQPTYAALSSYVLEDPTAYVGQVVAVVADTSATNNGLYFINGGTEASDATSANFETVLKRIALAEEIEDLIRLPRHLSYEQISEYDFRKLSGDITVNTAYTNGSKYIRDAYPDPNDQTKYCELFLGSTLTPSPLNQHWRAGLVFAGTSAGVNGFIVEVSANSVSGFPLNVEYPTAKTHATTKGYVDSVVAASDTGISTVYSPDTTTEHDVVYESNSTNRADGFLGVFLDMNALSYSNIPDSHNAIAIHSIEVMNGSGQTSKHNNRPVYASLYETVGSSINSAKYICSNTNGAQNNRYSDNPTMTFVFDDPIVYKNRHYLLLFHESEGVADNPISSCLTLGDATSRGLRVSVVPGPTNPSALETSSDMAGLSGGAEAGLVLGRTNTSWIPQFNLNAYEISSSSVYINGEPILTSEDIPSLNERIDTVSVDLEALSSEWNTFINSQEVDETIDTLHEIQTWINEHGTSATTIITNIEELSNDISGVSGEVSTITTNLGQLSNSLSDLSSEILAESPEVITRNWTSSDTGITSTDTNMSSLVINKLTRTVYDQLSTSGEINENEFYLIDEDSARVIPLVDDPVVATDAANKNYVDNKIGTVGANIEKITAQLQSLSTLDANDVSGANTVNSIKNVLGDVVTALKAIATALSA